MRIPIDKTDEVPLYKQVARYLKSAILEDRLPAGTRLPATRALAGELGLSRITVKNAYDLLEREALIVTREGSGTFVDRAGHLVQAAENEAQIHWPLWQSASLGADPPVPASPSRLARPTDLISFTGVTDPFKYPMQEFLRCMQEVTRRTGHAAWEYGNFGSGYPPLQQTITRILASQGIQVHAENVLITSGSQQALALTCTQLLREGDAILVEKPTYNLALDLFRRLRLKIIDVPVDEDGMQVETIEPFLQQYHPRLIYTIPNFQNPSGACMSVARRRMVLKLGHCYNIPILEDDYAGDLRYESRGLPAIKALDPGGQVIHIGTFSKMLMPALRVGYLLAEGPIFNQLVGLKKVIDLITSPLIQRSLDQYVTLGRYQAHLRRSTRVCRQRRDVMVNAVHTMIPGAEFHPPHGGLFLWLKLPEGTTSSELYPLALAAGVEFTTGTRFFSNPDEGESFIRLNFAASSEECILEGIRRLAAVVNH